MSVSLETYKEKLTIAGSPYRLICEYVNGWNVETSEGTEFVSSDIVGESAEFDIDYPQTLQDTFGDYIEGREPYAAEWVEEWQAYWTMPGYLDRGITYSGETEIEAIGAFLEDYEETSDYVIEALERLASIANESNDDDIRKCALRVIVDNLPDIDCEFKPDDVPENILFTGDVNPIDHGGKWFKVDNWRKYGYCDAVEICEYEGNVELSQGSVGKTGTTKEVGECFNIDPQEVEISHEIDYSCGQYGIDVSEDFSGRAIESFRRIEDSSFFLTSEGEIVGEWFIAERLKNAIEGM